MLRKCKLRKEKTRDSMKLIRLIRFIGMRVYTSIIYLLDIKMSKDNLFGGFPIANVMCCFCFEKLS